MSLFSLFQHYFITFSYFFSLFLINFSFAFCRSPKLLLMPASLAAHCVFYSLLLLLLLLLLVFTPQFYAIPPFGIHFIQLNLQNRKHRTILIDICLISGKLAKMNWMHHQLVIPLGDRGREMFNKLKRKCEQKKLIKNCNKHKLNYCEPIEQIIKVK